MLLTITTTHTPATDLGFLLHKNPMRVHTLTMKFGTAHIFYPEATAERFTARHAAGERHPGHVDASALPEFTAQIQQRWQPLDVAGPLIELDTSTTFDYEKLIAQITVILAGIVE